jgi:hypothetical protein
VTSAPPEAAASSEDSMPDGKNPVAPTARPAPTRAELVARWGVARRRRDAAPLGSEEHRRAVIEVGEIEVEINAIDVEASEGRQVRPAHPGERAHS